MSIPLDSASSLASIMAGTAPDCNSIPWQLLNLLQVIIGNAAFAVAAGDNPRVWEWLAHTLATDLGGDTRDAAL